MKKWVLLSSFFFYENVFRAPEHASQQSRTQRFGVNFLYRLQGFCEQLSCSNVPRCTSERVYKPTTNEARLYKVRLITGVPESFGAVWLLLENTTNVELFLGCVTNECLNNPRSFYKPLPHWHRSHTAYKTTYRCFQTTLFCKRYTIEIVPFLLLSSETREQWNLTIRALYSFHEHLGFQG